MENPFLSREYGMDVQAMDAVSRLDKVREFSTNQLKTALDVQGLQKSVRLAIERRLRKLEQTK
jgi:hypothetical protein